MIILHTLHWVQFAGTEKVCVDLCNEMSKKHTVYLLSNKKILPYISKRVKFIEVDFEQNRLNPIFLYRISKILRTTKTQIIHSHNTKELEIMYRARFFLSNKIPIVATKHTLRAKKRYKLADLSIAILEDTKEILPKNSIIIKNGMAYKEPKKIAKKDKFHIISAARLSKVKGHQTVIKALKKVDFDFYLSIFGEGEYKEELENLIKKLDLNDKVSIVGYVKNLQDYLYGCDLQIIASSFEPYGLTAIDGIYYSKILISTPTGICNQILPKELVFEDSPEDLSKKIVSIYDNYEKYKNIFAPVKNQKEQFSIEKMANKYILAYESLIK